MKILILVAIIAGFVYFMYNKADVIKQNTTEQLSQKYQNSVEMRMTPKGLGFDENASQKAQEYQAKQEAKETLANAENNNTGENDGRENNSTFKDDNISGL
ncbi:MAG: hypothetical protein CGEMS_1348 [Candidatus Campylobacter infans]|nr:MAG: hypothetical protein CGEMS_1348 [Candidatus Campylobacter infans]